MIEHGEQTGCVNTYHPVCLAAAERGGIETVIVLTGTKAIEALTDGVILHRGNPQTLHGFRTAGEIVHGAEYELALASCVAGVDNLTDIAPLHQRREQVKLLFLVPPHRVTPGFGDNGKVCVAPLSIFLVVHLGGGKLRQMSKTPGDKIIVSLKIAVTALVCAQHVGNGLCNRGLFGNHKTFHHINLSPYSSSEPASGSSSSVSYSMSSSSSSSP